ncbi:MAG TPA: DUF4288 domain-containing protein [Terriglobales bacterium]|nr:DUF4288 domain-containing protein [Terriglobales bacterium]
MGYIPSDVEWFVAELVMEITVHGARCNVVHRNLILVHAQSPEEAYEKALRNGYDAETEYNNPKGQHVEIRFRGISKLDVVYDELIDGAELSFEEQLAVPETDIQKLILPKERLAAFTAPNPGVERDPDYRSAEVMERAVNMSRNRDERD